MILISLFLILKRTFENAQLKKLLFYSFCFLLRHHNHRMGWRAEEFTKSIKDSRNRWRICEMLGWHCKQNEVWRMACQYWMSRRGKFSLNFFILHSFNISSILLDFVWFRIISPLQLWKHLCSLKQFRKKKTIWNYELTQNSHCNTIWRLCMKTVWYLTRVMPRIYFCEI